jgi:hypothetical protein
MVEPAFSEPRRHFAPLEDYPKDSPDKITHTLWLSRMLHIFVNTKMLSLPMLERVSSRVCKYGVRSARNHFGQLQLNEVSIANIFYD